MQSKNFAFALLLLASWQALCHCKPTAENGPFVVEDRRLALQTGEDRALGEVIQAIVQHLKEFLQSSLAEIVTTIKKLVSTFMDLADDLIHAGTEELAKLLEILKENLVHLVGQLQDVLVHIRDCLLANFSSLVNLVLTVLSGVEKCVEGQIEAIRDFTAKVKQQIGDVLQVVKQYIERLKTCEGYICVLGVFYEIGKFVPQVVGMAKSTLEEGVILVITTVTEVPGCLKNLLAEIKPSGLQLLGDVAQCIETNVSI